MSPRESSADSPNSAAFRPEADDIFARIARDYDRYCDLFSLYIHRHWKRVFSRRVLEEQGSRILDLASGTGDIPVRVLARAEAANRALEVVATDICQPMLDIAAPKFARFGGASIAIVNACEMPEIADDSYDTITMAFALKIIDRHRAMDEILRCLKPGGVFLCIEAARIPVEPIHQAYLAYMRFCLPLMGRLIARGDASAYGYLLKGIHNIPEQGAVAAELRAHGFADVSYQNLSFGIVAIHRATKPLRAA